MMVARRYEIDDGYLSHFNLIRVLFEFVGSCAFRLALNCCVSFWSELLAPDVSVESNFVSFNLFCAEVHATRAQSTLVASKSA